MVWQSVFNFDPDQSSGRQSSLFSSHPIGEGVMVYIDEPSFWEKLFTVAFVILAAVDVGAIGMVALYLK